MLCFYRATAKGRRKMTRMIPYDKMSKKQKRAYDEKRRVVWGISPVTRKKENAKAYSRKKARKWEDDVPLTALFLILYPAENVFRRVSKSDLA